MIDVLMSRHAFERLGARLDPFRGRIHPRLVDEDGLHQPWGAPEGSAGDVRFVVFATPDVMFGTDVAAFIDTAMAIEPLDWFQSLAAGVENPVLMAFGRKARLFTSTHGQAIAIAEYALWQGLDFLRAGPAHRTNRAAKSWVRVGAREVGRSHWLIYGFGEIGRETARRVRALGGQVTGVRRSSGPDADADRIIAPSEVRSALRDADIVMVCAPLTSETENMADAAFFASMKPRALFMNVGRGALVVEPDLMAALDAGTPAYAVLDVTVQEPLPPDSPLWDHPKIEMTPHDSPMTSGTIRRNEEIFLENLASYIEGRPLKHLVAKSTFN